MHSQENALPPPHATGVPSLVRQFVTVFIVLAVIANSGYALSTIDGDYELVLLVPAALCMVSIVAFKPGFLQDRINSSQALFLGLLAALFITLTANVELHDYRSYARFLSVISLAFCITEVLPFDNFLRYFLIVMRFVVIISLIVYCVVNVTHISLPFPVIKNINDYPYYNGIIVFTSVQHPDRNTGIFWEPGLFASILIYAIVLELCFTHKTNWYDVMLFLLGLLTTLSTAAFLLLPCVALLLINRRRKENTLTQGLLFASCVILLAATFVYADTIVAELADAMPSVFGKIQAQTRSMSTRCEGPLVDWKIFHESPLVGVGFRRYREIWSSLTVRTDIDSQTSTVTYFLATLGAFGLVYIIGIIKGVFSLRHVNLINKCAILTILIGILSKEAHQHIVLTYLLVFYFLQLGSRNILVRKLPTSELYDSRNTTMP
jgi:hypothetical protein